MPHTGQVAAASARPTRPGRQASRSTSVGSFRAGSPNPFSSHLHDSSSSGRKRRQVGFRRQSTQHGYQTFPTPPPKKPRTPGSASPTGSEDYEHDDDEDDSTPLPWKQLGLLALLSLTEQTALNSISPYLPTMVSSFDGIDESETGLYVGLLASAFALAQLATNLLWGYLSDIIGRKPVMLVGTSLLCLCFCAFGFCKEYWHIVLVHVAMGLLNGNAAVVPTVLGECTDRSNQSRAFTWLPVVYSLGSITGPALGGLLVGEIAGDKYPFLAPNIFSAAVLAFSVVVLGIWFEETHEEADNGGDWAEKVKSLLCCLKRNKNRSGDRWNSRWSRSDGQHTGPDIEGGNEDDNDREDQGLLGAVDESDETDATEDDAKDPADLATWRAILNRTTVILLATYLIFQLSNISFNSLYPIFASSPPPTGRDLTPGIIGVSLSGAGVVTIAFQVFLYRPMKSKLGNLGTYRGALFAFAVSMALMPWVGYLDSRPSFGIGTGKGWLYTELAVVLIIKNVAAVGGLSSVMLLITNCAPSHATLGTLNGIAQTLSAAGRSVGPFVSGGLFSLSTKVEPKGEALAWGIFAGISLVGWVGSYFIRGEGLESTDDGFEEAESNDDNETVDAP